MITFIHVAKHVNSSEFSLYEDVILDACCQNIASSDEMWEHAVEMSVLLVTSTQQNNPRSQWYHLISTLSFFFGWLAHHLLTPTSQTN